MSNVIVIDDFYKDPYDIRNFALQQKFEPHSFHPGLRSLSFTNSNIKERIQNFLTESAGKICCFNRPSNCSFQYNIKSDLSWIHSDRHINWAGVLFLTPDPPPNSGTSFYRFYDGTVSSLNNKDNLGEVMHLCRDSTKWEVINNVENKFNRLILYDSRQYHQSSGYFGNDINNGRLIQVFFFDTQY